MATHIGNEGVVLSGNNTVGEIASFELTETMVTADDSALTDVWDTHLAGSRSWNATVTARWDETDIGQGDLTIGASVTLKLYPEGNTSGDTFYSGTASVTSLSHSASRNTTQEVTFECTGNGNLTIATV